MTDNTQYTVPRGVADTPLEKRVAQRLENEREIREGLAPRDQIVSAEAHAVAAVQFARLLHLGRTSVFRG